MTRISNQEDRIIRDWIKQVRDDRITYPHGVPFEDALRLIEKVLEPDIPERSHISDFKSKK